SVERSGGCCALRLAPERAVPCEAPSGLPAGKVCGVRRPEDIHLANGAARAMLDGRIAEAVFFGESVRYAVALNSGLRLVAHVPGSRSHFAEGSEVHLSWAPDRIWILPPEKGGA